MQRPKYSYIYGLKDPRDGRIYYVGKSNRPERRKREHLENKTCNAARVAWIDDLQAHGLEPEMVILDETLRDDWQDRERYWIARGYEDGWPLVNIGKGGEGASVVSTKAFEFMHPYIHPDLRDVFDALPVREKDAICLETAMAMSKQHLPIIEYKISLHKYGTNQRVMWSIVNEEMSWIGAKAATAAVRERQKLPRR